MSNQQLTKEELKRRIEIADRVLRETRYSGFSNWLRDYHWLQAERARLVRELSELEATPIKTA
jgi:hypothetical protein